MKKEVWNKKTKQEKGMFIVRLVASIAVILFALLQLLKIWDKAIYVSAPLMGVVLLIQSIQEWEKSRGLAILGLICSAFIFICTIVALVSL